MRRPRPGGCAPPSFVCQILFTESRPVQVVLFGQSRYQFDYLASLPELPFTPLLLLATQTPFMMIAVTVGYVCIER